MALGGSGNAPQTESVQSNLTIQETLEIANLAARALGSNSPKDVVSAMKDPQKADGIAYALGDRVSKEKILEAARNIEATQKHTGGSVDSAFQMLNLLQQRNYGAANLSQMNNSGTMSSLVNLQGKNSTAFNEVLLREHADVAALKTAADEGVKRSLRTSPTYAPGTVGGITSRIGSHSDTIQNKTVDTALGVLGARAFAEIGGGRTQKYMGALGSAVVPEIVGNMRNGQGFGQAVMNAKVTGSDGIIARTIGGYVGGELTGKGATSIERALATGAGAQIGTDIVTGLVGRLLGGRGNDIRVGAPDYRTPGFGDGMNRGFNDRSGYNVYSQPSPDATLRGLQAKFALEQAGFSPNEVGQGMAGVMQAAGQANPAWQAAFGR